MIDVAWWSRYFASLIFLILVGKISANTFLYDGKLQIISGCEVLAASHELNQAEIFPTNKLEDCKAIERVA